MAEAFDDQIRLIDLLEFNRQIEGMLIAGIPLSWQGDDSSIVLKNQAERVASQAALRVAQGQSFLRALDSIPEVSLRYKAAFVGWVLSDRAPDAFEMIKSNTARLPHARKLWYLNLQLGLVFLLALLVLAVWLSIGKIDLLYNDSFLRVGPLSKFLEMLQSEPLFSLVGGVVALIIWGCLLHFAKSRITKLSHVLGAKEAIVQANWLKSSFMKLISSEKRSLVDAELVYESIVSSRNNCPVGQVSNGHTSKENKTEQTLPVGERSWFAPANYILWSAEKAVERRLAYRVSTLPYTMYFIGSGVVVFGVGLLVFGPLIELLYATVVPGAF